MPKLKQAIDEQLDFWEEEKEIDDKEPLEKEWCTDDPVEEHDNREWQAAIDNRIERDE